MLYVPTKIERNLSISYNYLDRLAVKIKNKIHGRKQRLDINNF